jgi:WD40 repeat protein
MSPGPDAEALFDRFLEELEEHEDSDFETFVSGHPDHADALRSLWARWSRMDARLETALPESLVDESFFHGTEHAAVVPGPATAAVAGAVVAGDYRLLRRIGQGGMGQVWEAEQLSLGRRVALKLLRPSRNDGANVQLLAREARAGGRLTHPGLVTVYAAGESDGVHYIAQELVGDGLTLADWMERQRSRPAGDARTYRELAELFATVAEAVQVAHDAGILHRDLKPSNILIGPDDRPMVSDFGLAHVSGEGVHDARPGLLGTWPYMSPEQAAGEDIAIDGRSDVFSLGAVLYEALTLRRAFEGDTGDMILARVLNSDPPDPRRIHSRIPEDLAVICLAALEKDRGKRYASMGGMAADLRRFLANEPILARPQGWTTRAVKWSRRHPAWTTTMASVSAALVIISALLANEVVLRRDAQTLKTQAESLATQAQESAALAAERTAEAERLGYLAAIRASAMHLDRGDHAAARPLLEGAAVPRRGWEWRHDALRADLSLRRLVGHQAAVNAVALSGDGSRAATASDDATVRLWTTADGRHVATLAGHAAAVTAVALSADGTLVASGDEDGSLLLWDADGTEPRERLPSHDAAVVALAMDRQGSRLVSAALDGSVRVRDLATGVAFEVLGDLPAGSVTLGLSADGARLVSASSSGKVLVHDLLPDGPSLVVDGYWEAQIVVGLDADGGRVLTGSADGLVLSWDPLSVEDQIGPGTEGVTSLKAHEHPVSHMIASDDGRRLVTASSEANDLRVFDRASGQLRAVLTGHDPLLTSVGLSPDGRVVLGGGSDGSVLVWDGETRGASVPLLGHEHPVSTLAASADGGVIVSGSLTGDRAIIWDGSTGRARASLPDHAIGVRASAVSADGSVVVTAGYDRFVRLWDGADGAPLPHLVGHGASVTSVAVDGTGRLVASGSHDRTARLWNPDTGHRVASFTTAGGAVTSVALDHEGALMVYGSQDGSVHLARTPWDDSFELKPGTWSDDGVASLSADGSTACWASASEDLIVVWNTADGSERARLQGSRRGLAAVALSADGSRVLSVASRDDGLRLRETDTGETLALLLGHDGPVTALTLTADGRRVISSGRDRSVRVWESERASAQALWHGLAGGR